MRVLAVGAVGAPSPLRAAPSSPSTTSRSRSTRRPPSAAPPRARLRGLWALGLVAALGCGPAPSGSPTPGAATPEGATPTDPVKGTPGPTSPAGGTPGPTAPEGTPTTSPGTPAPVCVLVDDPLTATVDGASIPLAPGTIDPFLSKESSWFASFGDGQTPADVSLIGCVSKAPGVTRLTSACNLSLCLTTEGSSTTCYASWDGLIDLDAPADYQATGRLCWSYGDQRYQAAGRFTLFLPRWEGACVREEGALSGQIQGQPWALTDAVADTSALAQGTIGLTFYAADGDAGTWLELRAFNSTAEQAISFTTPLSLCTAEGCELGGGGTLLLTEITEGGARGSLCVDVADGTWFTGSFEARVAPSGP